MEGITTTTKERILEAAEATGLDTGRIQTVKFELAALRQQGILVDLEIKGVSMFTRGAIWAELGIGEDDVRKKQYTPGSKYLIPKDKVDALRSVEQRMRQALDKFSFDIPGFRPHRWIPYTAYKQFRERWEELLAEFQEAKDTIIEEYDQYRDALAAEFAQGARRAWKAILGQGYVAAILEGRAYIDESEFVDRIVEKALARMPSPEEIETRLTADYAVALIYGDQDVAADELEARRLREQARLEQAKARAQEQEEYYQANLLAEQHRHEREMNLLAEQEKRESINAMFAAEMEHARNRLGEMTSPLDDIINALRRQMAEAAREIQASIQKNGHLRGSVARKARGLVELYQTLAVHDDRKLREYLENLKAEIGPVGDRGEDSPERDINEIQAALQSIVDLVHETRQDINRGPSRASFLEI